MKAAARADGDGTPVPGSFAPGHGRLTVGPCHTTRPASPARTSPAPPTRSPSRPSSPSLVFGEDLLAEVTVDKITLSNSVHRSSQDTRNGLRQMSETKRMKDTAERRSAKQLRKNFRRMLPRPESLPCRYLTWTQPLAFSFKDHRGGSQIEFVNKVYIILKTH